MDNKQFLKKLNIWLSFFYEEEDVKNIICDYEERLVDGNLAIPQSAFHECISVIKSDDVNPLIAFFKTRKTKSVLLFFIFSIITIAAGICSDNLRMNMITLTGITLLLYVLTEIYVWKTDYNYIRTESKHIFFYYAGIILLIFIIGIACLQGLTQNMGEIIVRTWILTEIVIVAVVIFRSCCNSHFMILDRQFSILLFSVSAFVISRLHIMQDDISKHFTVMLGGVALLCLENYILHRIRIGVSRKWMHN